MGDEYGEGGGGSESKNDLKVILANGLVAFSGGYGLSLGQPPFAGPSYILSLISGSVAVINNVLQNDLINTLNIYTSGLGRCFIIPLIACEVTCANGIELELTLLHLVYPTIHYLGKYIFKQHDLIKPAYLQASHTLSILTIGYFSFIKESWWGVGLAVTYAIACFGQDIFNDPHVNHALVGVGNLMYILKVY